MTDQTILPADQRPVPGVPLYVDLDGTLISSDVLWEGLVALLKQNPLSLLLMPIWLGTGGRARVKQELASRTTVDVTSLPYRKPVLEFLHTQKTGGRSLVLATAADQSLARAVSRHLNLFDDVLCSDGTTNLKGPHKLEAIRGRSSNGFGYVGDSPADLPIWASATEVHVVAPSRSLLARLRSARAPDSILCPRGSAWRPIARLLRPHQWVKNLLVFLPMLLAHHANDPHKWAEALIVFVSLCLCASSVYILNDLLDVTDDRHHPTKSRRPLASGTVSLRAGLALFPSFLLAGLLLALTLPALRAAGLLAFYWCCSAAYSIHFKRRLLLDVFILAGLYTLRILIGGAATVTDVSPWMLAFSVFFFVSLAFAKRYAELRKMRDLDHAGIRGRGYLVDDLAIIESVGPASGYMAVLVLALYLNSEIAKNLYPRPLVLLLICPLMMYWLTRVWFFARRGWLNMDPVVFATRDRISWYTAALAIACWLFAGLHLGK